MTLTQQLEAIDTALAALRPLTDLSDWSVATEVLHRADISVVKLESLRGTVALLLAQENVADIVKDCPCWAKTA